MASTANPTRADFEAMLNEQLGGAGEDGFEGRVVKGTVTAIENDLAVIDIGLKSEGRVPLREFAMPGQKADLKVGDEVEAMIINVDRKTRGINLSIKAKDQAEQHEAMQKFSAESSVSSGTTNLGALLKAKLNNPQ